MTPAPDKSAPGFFKVAVTGAVTCAGVMVALWLILGRSAAEKTATVLVMPCGLLWLLLCCAVYWVARQNNKKMTMMMVTLWAMVTIGGNGLVSAKLASSLERTFLNIRPLQKEPYDVVVVLGGGASVAGNGRQQGNSSGDRLILAAQLYHAGIARSLICTGRRIRSMDSTGFDPSDQSRDILIRLGVPESAIEQLGGRTTSEEMETLGKRFGENQQRVGVVTSAWHLPRALLLANRNNFYPDPLPADFMTGPVRTLKAGEIIGAMIPQGGAFMGMARVAKEYLGMLVGR